MLILTRRISEDIVIDGKIVVRVLGVKGSQVRLGIHAPRDVAVHRGEIHNRIHGVPDDWTGQAQSLLPERFSDELANDEEEAK